MPPLPAVALAGAEERALARLVCALHEASLARDAGYAGADWGEVARLALTDSEAELLAAPADVVPPAALAASVAGAAHVAAAVDDALRVLAPRESPRAFGGVVPRAPPAIDLPPILGVDAAGVDNRYDLDYALVVDVGGNDVYDNNAGGAIVAFGDGTFFPLQGDRSTWQHVIAPTGEHGPKVVVGGDFEDGELLFSATLLLDLAGDDAYGVKRAPVIDARCTSEHVVPRVAMQGAGAGGPGLLFDLGGANVMHAKTIAQGAGHVGGAGVLYLGDGDDRLEAVRLAQGSGLFFGVGLLVNSGGDDSYVARAPAGGLHNTDQGFCDDIPRYAHGSGFARVTGGASGVAGALLDLAGNDRYVSHTKTTGFAEVASFALLYDAAGDDVYEAHTMALGYATGHHDTGGNGLGLLVDAAGRDRYVLTGARGLGDSGGVLPEGGIPAPYFPPNFWLNDVLRVLVDPLVLSAAGALVDGEGEDAYVTSLARANGEVKPVNVGGVFADLAR